MNVGIDQNTCVHTNLIFPLHMLYFAQFMNSIKSEIEIKLEENEEKEKEVVCKESQKINKNNITNEITQKNNFCHIFPGQSKNYYKNMGQKIAQFILQEFSDDKEILQEPAIKKFLKMESQKFNRNSIELLIKSKKGRRICRLFFAQYKWVKPFLVQNKADLGFSFRFNKLLYSNRQSTSEKANRVEDIQIKQEN
ncbi:unnamed protein product (macronuclear) [Paramecium tetraurelia]|uniref:Uncharacterized protein n=1 Tax=Paramecium tetraurelia TaxID=5888 RepID=A0CL38_PARTE|nr:uncharacterized protein GSPATT00008052001 [Paramecium tetraurelia]CAK71505.1 unnamed protein product [Paramecium tetraurelia]|eukprot:XP_001438902.1 hypothetical protein (macronuclear) [Paramecium tetraurelia strain d4-2]